jgi:Family of unknown function (DUF6364)
MRTKLTLRIDEDLIARAKAYSKRTGKSVSRMVADYLSLLPERSSNEAASLTPTVRSLHGLLRGSAVDEQDYRRHLEEKYR